MQLTIILPLLLALSAAPLTVLAGMLRPAWAARTGALLSGLAFGAILWGWLEGGGTLDLPWVPTWNLRLSFALDGLAALYGLLATGIGFLVIIYSTHYIALHLEHEERSDSEQVHFYAFLLLFMGAMVGLVMAQDLILNFIFWDITAIASYYLIGYDRHHAHARSSALMALLVTGITSVCFLIGALLLYRAYETFSIPELIARAEAGPLLTIAGLLIALAALAKSAQIPFHFWLPRAMAAPTPVSAYLHSAAMVAAGVFLLQRLYPLLEQSPLILNVLLVIGMLSMAIGGILALTRDVLKQVLAYSTIAQYGYVVVLLGLGGSAGVKGATFYVIAHALCKSGLFLTAGAVTEATEKDRLSKVGGLLHALPALAFGSGALAAGLAALPFTIGFFKDELFFAAALEHSWTMAAFAVAGAAFTFAYIWRFWSRIFLGEPQGEVHHLPATMVAPVFILGLVVCVGGIVTEPFTRLAAAAASVTAGNALSIHVAYHVDARPENLMALSTYAVGLLLIGSYPLWERVGNLMMRLGNQFGSEYWYASGLRRLNTLSRHTQAIELRDLRWRIASLLVAGAVLLGVSLIVTPTWSSPDIGSLTWDELPLMLALLLTALTGLLVVVPRNFFLLVLALSSLGYSLAVVYAFLGAPDVALVAVLIETILTLLLLGALVLFPDVTLNRAETEPGRRDLRWRNPLVSIIVGMSTFIVVWKVLSQPVEQESVAREHIALAREAHAGDITTAILADFRGLDTMGEITVISIALLGVIALLQFTQRKKV